MTNKSFLRFFIFCLNLVFILGCQSYEIKPGSERIRVFESEPKNCLYSGEVSSVQENIVTGSSHSEIEMDLPTRVDLRNKAFVLGGNVLVFMPKKKIASGGAVAAGTPAAADSKKSNTTTPAAAEADNSERKINTVFLATVFRCPASIVNQ